MSSIRNPKGFHHTEHETGGVDAIATLDGSILTTGTIPDARFSANVPLVSASNTFTADQTISKAVPRFGWNDTSAPVDGRLFRIANAANQLQVFALNDAATIVQATPLQLSRSGDLFAGRDLYEKGRAAPVGHWTTLTPTLGAQAGSASLAGNNACSYMLVGKTLFLNFYLNVTLSTATTWWSLALPAGMTIATYAGPACTASGGLAGIVLAAPGSTQVAIQRDAAGSMTWSAGTAWYAAVAPVPLT